MSEGETSVDTELDGRDEFEWTMLDALISANERGTAAIEACLVAHRNGSQPEQEELERHLDAAIEDVECALEDLQLARQALDNSSSKD